MSALRCVKCPGYFLPNNPLGKITTVNHLDTICLSSDCECKWVCTECNTEAPPGYQEMANAKVAEAVAQQEEEGLSPASCEKFIKTYSKVLHPHHAHMLDIKFSLLNLLGHTEGFAMSQLTEEQLSLKESLARTFLEIASKILPGISRLKGTALFELYLVMQQRGVRAMASLDLSPAETLMILKNALSHLAECIECLQYEPSGKAEGKMCARAREEEAQMVGIIRSIEEKL